MRLFQSTRRDADRAAAGLYEAAVAQARLPDFYLRAGVPDTADGRFELIALHVWLVLRRLRREPEGAEALAQALYDAMFADMDRSLREMGAGDLGVGPRVKAMAQAFMGRIAAYDAALAADEAGLEDALKRNLFRAGGGDAANAAAIGGYIREQAAALDGQAADDLARGEIRFLRPDFGMAAAQ